MNTPLLFLIFNRPEITKQVFEEIKKAKPQTLYIAADGPRKNRYEDELLCKETRQILEQIDWVCNIKTLLREDNLGCKNAVSSAIDWFFQHEEYGIILEDDCLPHATFFEYCETMLERYKHDTRIAHICGVNFQTKKIGDGDYYFSNLTHVWGWASWRRAWKNYDINMNLWPTFREDNYLKYLFPSWKVYRNLTNIFDKTYQGKINTWDYQLFFSNLLNGKISIIPNTNLISNIGFTLNATHTVKGRPYANLPIFPMKDFRAPTIMLPNIRADLSTLKIESASNLSILKNELILNIKGWFTKKQNRVYNTTI